MNALKEQSINSPEFFEYSHAERVELLRFDDRSQRAKRAIDVALAGAALLATLPLLVVLFCLVRADGGPAFFGHRRVGRNNRTFVCWKFRTMVPDSEDYLHRLLVSCPQARAQWERERKLDPDPRITRLGAVLRRTSLDELPQLVNVLRGDMSLVGPRPVVADELERFYRDRSRYYLSVRPGLTGLWQVSGRNGLSYAARVRLDAWYVMHWSLFLDLRILLRTVRVVASGRGAV